MTILKKKLVLSLALLLTLAVSVYFYLYSGHRDIASEGTDFTLSITQLQSEFGSNESVANKKYLDKVLELSGKLTATEPENKAIVIDGKLFSTFNTALPEGLQKGKQITIKGRFVGYDDLLEEFRMDQTQIVNSR